MQYEVEQKLAVDHFEATSQALAELGATPGETVDQTDRYYAHPARDFASTDEALRIRQVGQQWQITYKGPKLAGATKTRREIELPIAAGDPDTAQGFGQLLEALGFAPQIEVRKTRQTFQLAWQDHTVAGALDEVAGLGRFVELEILADENHLEPAQAAILSLAERLGLSRVEPRSYLEMLLENSTNQAKSW